ASTCDARPGLPFGLAGSAAASCARSSLGAPSAARATGAWRTSTLSSSWKPCRDAAPTDLHLVSELSATPTPPGARGCSPDALDAVRLVGRKGSCARSGPGHSAPGFATCLRVYCARPPHSPASRKEETMRSRLIVAGLALAAGAGLPGRAHAQQCNGNAPHVTGEWVTLPYQMTINPISVSLLRSGRVLIVAGSENDARNFSEGSESYRAALWDPTG